MRDRWYTVAGGFAMAAGGTVVNGCCGFTPKSGSKLRRMEPGAEPRPKSYHTIHEWGFHIEKVCLTYLMTVLGFFWDVQRRLFEKYSLHLYTVMQFEY
jgi:hypothetical protein